MTIAMEPDAPPTTPARTDILGEKQLAELLSRAAGQKISVEKLRKQDYPGFNVGRDRFYIYGQVLDTMAARAAGEEKRKQGAAR